MRTGELECRHGVGHSAGIHGCDGCCGAMMREAMANAWEEGFDAGEKDYAIHSLTGQWDTDCTPNPYRQGESK